MHRLAASFKHDTKIQYRQGFYAASLFVLVTLAVLLSFIPQSLAVVLPAVLLTNMVIVTFVFIGGLLLLEKGERTLESLVVTPLRPTEYLASKVITLTFLAIVENLAITILSVSNGLITNVNWGWMILGSLISGLLYTLFGFLTVIRYNSLNEYLMPMVGVTLVLQLPALVCFGVPEYRLLYLLPTHGPLLLFQAALESSEPWQLIYAMIYPTLWIIVLFWIGRRALPQFVARTIGEA